MGKRACLIFIVFAVIFSSAAVFAAISGLNLNSPDDNIWTNDSTTDFNFTVASDIDATLNCTLYVNGSAKGSDNSVQNGTATVITASNNLTDGTHSWHVNCTDANETKQSYARTIHIDTAAPSSALSSPASNYNSSSTSMTFNCSAADLNLSNVTLYGNWSGSWKANETKNIGGASNSSSFSKTISEGKYIWNCYACDSLNHCAFASSNRTFTIDAHNPEVNLRSPADGYNTTSKTISFKYNATDNLGAKNCSLYIDGDLNETDSSIENGTEQTFSATFSTGTYDWTVECYDYSGKSDKPGERELIISSSSGAGETGDTGNQTQTTQNAGTLSSSGKTMSNLGMGYIVNFNLGIDPHSVTVNDVTSNSATILIKSTTITTTLFANDTKTFDLNLNNKTDFSITLLKISGGKADLLLKSIPETSAGAPPNMPNATFTPNMTGGNMTNITNKTNATNATAKQGAQFSLESKALIIIISVIAAIAIGAAIGATIALLKIRKKNYWKKERTDWHKPKRMDYEYS